MVNTTIKTSAPVVGAGYLSVFWLCLLIDTFSNSFLGGLGTFLITAPVVGSLLALLIVEAVVCLGIPSQRAQDWWNYVHETTGGALIVSVMSLPWILAIATLGLLVVVSFWLGGGAIKAPLDWIAKMPILGPFVALLLALSFVAVAVMLFAYVAFLTFASVMRLVRAPRTGYVENSMPIYAQGPREDDEAVESGEFGRWESNRG
ncbi:hypothetical protein NLU13_1378 [Sarocladium strictum]|uniref:Uncharacterized protein n=1 Tax=Sarocladium strictum TaxID=5046 RepID=A0AA39LCB1_SARSR|nr:hypothetical protein NLU13_1378 [Sarocladium strictum]